MRRVCLGVARFCSAFWVGAAFLFVVTSVTEQVQPSFDAATKDTLALIRFPWYYGAGVTLLGAASLAASCARITGTARRAAQLLLLAALALMGGDYVFVYRPMRAELTPPGGGHGPGFQRSHHWSEGLNAAGFLLSAAAAVLLCSARDDGAVRAGR